MLVSTSVRFGLYGSFPTAAMAQYEQLKRRETCVADEKPYVVVDSNCVVSLCHRPPVRIHILLVIAVLAVILSCTNTSS
jgi:hypothetical protein